MNIQTYSVTGSGTGNVTGAASSTANAIARFSGTGGKTLKDTPQVTIDDSGIITCAWTTEKGLQMTSSFGAGASDNLVLISTTNTLWDRPLLRINDVSTAGGAANIRIDSPNPDIEMICNAAGVVSPDGKFEWDVNSTGKMCRWNSRNAADNSFEPNMTMRRYAEGGGVGIGTQFDLVNAGLEIVPNVSVTQGIFYISSAVGGTSGNIFAIDVNKNMIFNDAGNAVNVRMESDTDANCFVIDGTNNVVNIGFAAADAAAIKKLNVSGEVRFGKASTTTGRISLGKSTAAGYTIIEPGAPGSDVTITCPAVTGTMALTTDCPIPSRVTADFSVTSSTTLVNVTGLTFTVSSSTAYQFEAHLFTTSNSAGGVKAAIAGTATATNIAYEGNTESGGTWTQTRSAALAGTVGAVTAVTAAYIVIKGLIEVNAGGTLTVQFAQNVSNGTASVVLRGSYFKVQKVT